MSKRNRENKLTVLEVGLVKAMLAEGDLNDQAILAYFTRPGRTVNHARVAEIRDGKRHTDVPVASERELRHFSSRWPEHD